MAAAQRKERLDLRLPADQKLEIERAAALSGQTVSNYILGTMVPKSRKVIREAEVITLSARDRARVMAALDNVEAKPNAALLRAAKRYNATMG
jgi:uncharacterized protein (DUF1778 family)